MTDENPAAAGEQAQGPQFLLQKIYLKDLSFEAPQGVQAFKQAWKPKINQDLNTATAKVEDGLFEVVLKLTITAEMEDKTVFLVEVQQAGLFLIRGLEGQQLTQALNTACPNILFPYAREAIDSAVVKGGFPALAIPPINFDVLFAQAIARAQQEKEGATEN